MRVKVLALVVVLLLVPAASSDAGMRPPTVTRAIAERETAALLQKIGTWRYRTDGYLDCRFGKINRIRWACRVGWYKGRFCRFGRVQVYGFLEGGQQWFGSSGKLRRC